MKLKIVELCRRKGVTMAWLAEQLGCSVASLKMNRDGGIKLDKARQVAKVLGVQVSDLIDNTDTKDGVYCPHCGRRIGMHFKKAQETA